ncbi:hypothetical protein GCM10007386_02110 [Pseudoduganella dura]|nr:hypothetical protein GCM10007386_02110 [Pseudoduganella dura]
MPTSDMISMMMMATAKPKARRVPIRRLDRFTIGFSFGQNEWRMPVSRHMADGSMGIRPRMATVYRTGRFGMRLSSPGEERTQQ